MGRRCACNSTANITLIDSHPPFLDVCHSKVFVVLRNRLLIPPRGVGICKNPKPSLHAECANFSEKTPAKNQLVMTPNKSDAHHQPKRYKIDFLASTRAKRRCQ